VGRRAQRYLAISEDILDEYKEVLKRLRRHVWVRCQPENNRAPPGVLGTPAVNQTREVATAQLVTVNKKGA
jgi:hypothetical protein